MPRNARQNFNAAVAWLQERKIYFTNPGAGHIKIGPRVNFWPTHGKVYLDGDKQCHPDRGLPALEAVLREQGYLGGPTAPTTPPRRAGPIQPLCPSHPACGDDAAAEAGSRRKSRKPGQADLATR